PLPLRIPGSSWSCTAAPRPRLPTLSLHDALPILFTTNVVLFTGTAKDPLPDDTGVRQVFLQVNADPPEASTGTKNWSGQLTLPPDRKSTRLNSSHLGISYAVFCLKKKTKSRSADY